MLADNLNMHSLKIFCTKSFSYIDIIALSDYDEKYKSPKEKTKTDAEGFGLMRPFFEIVRDEDSSFYCTTHENNSCFPHFHSNIEIVCVTDGEMEATINSQTTILHPGDVSIAASYDIHHYATPQSSKMKLLLIPTNMVGRFTVLTKSQVFATPFLIKNPRSQAIFEAVGRLEEFNNTKDSVIVKGYLYAILGFLIEQLGLKEYSTGKGALGPVRDILLYIERHYLETVTVSDLAAHFGYNKDYFSRLFNDTLGCGFNHYINMIRARHAASLIRNSDSSITEIAYASGFNNLRTFSRAFCSLYGMTANSYKKGRVPLSDMDMEIIKFQQMNS